jgi:GTP-binding protein HflX
VLAEDKLFATLDPTTRRVALPSGREVLVTDTVGFINNLPTFLIAAFRATLEEINEATVLLHVVDVTHPNVAEQVETVAKVLEELGADDRPTVAALNKVDALGWDPAQDPTDLVARVRSERGPDMSADAVAISAREGWGLDRLLARVEAALEVDADFVPVALTVPYARTDLVDRFHRTGRVEETRHDEVGTTLLGQLPAAELGRFAPYVALRPRGDEASPPADDRVPDGAAAADAPESAA